MDLPIGTFGTRLVTVCFLGCNFVWDFVLVSITVSITVADFLCANGLLVDVNRRFIDALSFATFSCLTGGSGPLTREFLDSSCCFSAFF